MPYKINVSLKDKNVDPKYYEAAKKQVEEQGGTIVNEYKLVKGFTAEFPDDTVHSLSTNEHLNVENDGKVTTQ